MAFNEDDVGKTLYKNLFRQFHNFVVIAIQRTKLQWNELRVENPWKNVSLDKVAYVIVILKVFRAFHSNTALEIIRKSQLCKCVKAPASDKVLNRT